MCLNIFAGSNNWYQNKKIYLGVKNSFCIICKRTENKGLDNSDHKCFKNWADKPCTARESDIIAEGFNFSLQMHGLIYGYIVGDGDSSVIKKNNDSKPYGKRIIKKIECKNHLIRNDYNKLRELCKKHMVVNKRKYMYASKII